MIEIKKDPPSVLQQYSKANNVLMERLHNLFKVVEYNEYPSSTYSCYDGRRKGSVTNLPDVGFIL